MADTSIHLTEGHYKVTDNWYKLLLVKGATGVIKGTTLGDLSVDLKYRDIGDADQGIFYLTGKSNHVLELTLQFMKKSLKCLESSTKTRRKNNHEIYDGHS